MSIRRSGRIQARATNAVPARRAPLTDITTNTLNGERETPRSASPPKRQRVSQENIEEPELAQIHNVPSQEPLALSQITIESAMPLSGPIFRLAIQRITLTSLNSRPKALWSLDPSSPSLFTQAQQSLAGHTRYQDVLPPLLAQSPIWLASVTDSIHAHHRRIEALSAYQLDLSYAPVLKTVTGTDRAELVDIILYFSTRVRLKHPTMHLAVHILDRYLAALLRRSERTPFEPSGAPGGAAEGGVWDAYWLSQEAQELLGVPHALKCITCVCIWLAAKVEEEQGRFNWRRLHNVVFEEVPVAQWPSENRLHLLMSLVAQTLSHDLNPPTAYTFLCHLVPLAGLAEEDVLVARCLAERVLLEDPPSRPATAGIASTTTTASASTVVQGVFPLSLIAASCILLTRYLLLQRRASANTTSISTASTTEVEAVVWTAELRHFSGYCVKELRPCVASLVRMLQQETYLRARLYAHPLCPSGRYAELALTLQAMYGVGSGGWGGGWGAAGGNGGVGGGVGGGVDPLQSYLRVLLAIFVHMQDSLIRDTTGYTPTTINTNTNAQTARVYNTQDSHTTQDSNTTQGSAVSSVYTPVVLPTTAELRNTRMQALLSGASSASGVSSGYDTPLFTQGSTGSTQGMFSMTSIAYSGVLVPTPVRRAMFAPPSVARQATTTSTNTTNTATQFRIFGQGVSTSTTTNTTNTTTLADIAAALPTNLAGEYSQLSLPPYSFSQACERSEGDVVLSQSSVNSTTVDNNAVFGRASSIGNTNNTTSTTSATTTTHPATTATWFFDPHRMLYSQDGFSNLFAASNVAGGTDGVGNVGSTGGAGGATFGRVSALSAAANTSTSNTTANNTTRTPALDRGGAFSIFTEPRPRNPNANTTHRPTTASTGSTTTPSVLGRRDRSAFTTATPGTSTSSNTTAVHTVTLNPVVQDLYRLYPAPVHTSSTTSTTTTSNTTSTALRGVLDHALTHTAHLPAVRNSVRDRYRRVSMEGADGVVRFVDFYSLLVCSPPV